MRVLRSIIRAMGDRDRTEVTELIRREMPSDVPGEDVLMNQFVARLPDCDYRLLAAYKAGKPRDEIAKMIGTDVETVHRSLARIYSEMRMSIYGGPRDPAPEDAPVPLLKTG